MSKNQIASGAARLLAVAIGTYDHHPQLGEVVPVTRMLIDVFARCGFVQDHPELVGEQVKVETINAAVKQWFLARKEDDRFLVYWTGHGLPSNLSEHLLAATDTPVDPVSFQAIPPGFLVELLIRSPAQVGLLVIDTCFSGKSGVIAGKQMDGLRATTIPLPRMMGKRIGVLTTSHPTRMITSPVVGAALVKVLSDPDSGSVSWGRRDASIGLKQVQEALHAEIGKSAGVHIDWRAWQALPSGWATDDGTSWLSNPTWLGQTPDELVELQRTLLGLTEAGSHWDLSHRGLEVGSSGWVFVGREVTLQQIVAWLKLDVIERLADAFGLENDQKTDRKDLRTVTEALVSHLYHRGSEGHTSTVAIDALDEARANHERSIALLCRRLGEIPGVRVFVGVRYSITGDPVPHDKDRHALLKQVWPDCVILDVNDDPNTRADLVRYIETRIATRHRQEEQCRRMAEAVAARALSGGGYFLYARIVARTLLASEILPNPEGLPTQATEAFATDLLTRFGRDRDRFDDLLGALAWGYGSGLPKAVWTQVASAISAEGAGYEMLMSTRS